MLSELVFEQIEGNFWYAAYGPFRVVMMKDNGYINATKMCTDGDKHFFRWKENKTSQALIQAMQEMLSNACEALEMTDLGIPRSVISPYKTVNTGNKTEIAA